LYLNCPNPHNCSFEFLNENIFKRNTAKISGGGIYWSDIKPKLVN